MKLIFPGSLRARLFLLVFAVLIPAAVVVVWGGINQREMVDAQYHQEALHLAEFTANNFYHLVQEGRITLTLLRQLPDIERVNGHCSVALAAIRGRHRRFDNLGVIGADGRTLCSALPLHGSVYLGDRPYFKRAMATGKFTVGGFQVGRITGRPGVVVALPLPGAGGRSRDVLFATLSLRWLSDSVVTAHELPGTVVSITDNAGRLIVQHPRMAAAGTVLPLVSRLLGRPQDGSGTLTARGFDHRRALFGYTRLATDSGGGLVLASIPASLAEAPVRHILARNLWVLVGLLCVALAAVWTLGETLILRKTRALISAAQRLSAGETAVRTGLRHGGDELSRVAATFDSMAESLEQRERELRGQVEQIARLNRTYRLLTAVNSLLIRAREQQELFRDACRIATEQGGFLLAWIGAVDRSGGRVRPLTWSGLPDFDAERLWLPLEPADTPTARAVRESRSSVCDDFLNDPGTRHWRVIAERVGIASSATLPLRVGDEVRWVFVLYAREPGFFDAEELMLLEQLAADISLGLRTLGSELELGYLATHDAVTDLPNRRLLTEQLDYALKRARHSARHVAAVELDIADFQRLSDLRGPHAGDALLRELTTRLRAILRDGDTLGRDTGARLAVILADVAGPQDVRHVVERILGDLPATLRVGGDDIPLSVRAGIAVFPGDADTPEGLLNCALLALQGKDTGADGTVAFFSPALNHTLQENRRLEQALRHAIENETLELHYQPVVDAVQRKLVGFEALARWRSQEFGMVPPGRFIPLAEAGGLILPLGEWALRTAGRQALLWEQAGHRDLRIVVNVSFAQLRERDFPERVRSVLESVGGVPHRVQLALEITESMLIADLDAAMRFLRGLKQLGLALYLDDFGTGHSSLSYLHRLPFDVIKVDQAFIRGLPADASSAAIIKSIVGIAGVLGVAVIAEGVETEPQLALLRELGCGFVQGYLLGRPMPAVEAERLLAAASGDRGSV